MKRLILCWLLNLLCQVCWADAVTIMPMGDSISRGFQSPFETRGSYRRELEKSLVQYDVEYDYVGDFNFAADGLTDGDYQAKDGYRIEDVIANFGPSLAKYQPDIVLLLAGTNNHWDGPAYPEFVSKYEELIGFVHENSPSSRVVISTVPKFGCCRSEKIYWTEEWVRERNEVILPTMNRAIEQVANRYAYVDTVDLYSVLDPQEGLSRDDWVHLNLVGQTQLANLYFDVISTPPYGLFDIDTIDSLAARIRATPPDPTADLNGSGNVNWDDLEYLVHEKMNLWFGDANLDGAFNTTDLVSVFTVGEFHDDLAGNSTWASGDWDGDGDFTGRDLDVAIADGAYESRSFAAPVPEPTTASLTSLAVSGPAVVQVAQASSLRSSILMRPVSCDRVSCDRVPDAR